MSSASGFPSPNLQPDVEISRERPAAHQDEAAGYCPRLFSRLLIALSYILDVQESPHLYHGWRVTALATAMAPQIVPEQVADVFFAALVHDVGAMGQFSHIVNYPMRRDHGGRAEILSHPSRGAETVREIPGLERAADFVANHHEWWNGEGYPARKMGEMIPIGAQLIRAADSADIAKKLRIGVPVEEAIEMAELLSGIEIRTEVAEVFRKVLSNQDFYFRLTDETKLLGLIHELESELDLPGFYLFSDVTYAVLTVIARAVDSKHSFTSGHSERVARYAESLARAMSMPDEEITKIRFAGLLHDVGKVAISKSIIDKPGPLNESEMFQVKHYPVLTMAIVGNIVYLSDLAWIAGHHHERWDGAGYPDSLRGEDIPLLSRILGVADALDALTSPRAHRPAKTTREALRILREGSGTQFDPHVVEVACAAWGSVD